MNDNEWISVKELLPDVFLHVLIYGSKGHYAIGCVDASGAFDDYGLWEDEHVTHWMPLPEPPKQ
jgi:hypothetical protein